MRRFTLISSDAKIKEKRARSFGLVLSFAPHVGVLFGGGGLFENGAGIEPAHLLKADGMEQRVKCLDSWVVGQFGLDCNSQGFGIPKGFNLVAVGELATPTDRG